MAIDFRVRRALRAGLTFGLLAGLMACGGSSSSPTGATRVIVSDSGTGTSAATITITSNGVSPSQVAVGVGQAVTFINNDTRSHEIASNPHPAHGSCPSIEAGLGTIAAGQTKITHAFGNTGTCGFHDHQDPNNSGLQGQIVIQ
jgi:plastocyanin